MPEHQVVTREEWTAARASLLRAEKELTHRREELTRKRRELPWTKVEKKYLFQTTAGERSLSDLFDGRSQLIVYHFMLGPDWKEGCHGCSFVSDHFDGALVHLAARDVAFTAVSRAPLAQIEAFKKRMCWHFDWVSSFGSDFNYDFGVSFTREQVAAGRALYNYGSQEFSGDECRA